jgi:hypothetical protein
MKTCLSSVWRLILCGIEAVGLSICGPLLSANLGSLMPIVPQADCPRDLSIRVTSNPAHIASGQTSAVSWSVDGPSACLPTSVELNGEPVSPRGSQIVMPSQSTTYRITVSYQSNGIHGQKEAFAHVTVSHPLVAPLCPAIVLPQAVEIWEPDLPMDKQPWMPAGQWLTGPLMIPHTTLLPGPEIIWMFGEGRDEDTARANGPGLALLSACVLLPATTEPQVDDSKPQGSDPAAASSDSIVVATSLAPYARAGVVALRKDETTNLGTTPNS